ncbi:Phytochrome-like protein cph1 [compost metagenome]
MVTYFIVDNGIGMDLQKENNIFDIFQRLSNSSGYDGSGIGLSIVKRIIDRLGADIRVESAVGKGTTFEIIFENAE